jgi:hypothetical protein
LTGQGYAVYPEASTGITADHRVFFSTLGPDATEAGDVQCEPLDAMLYCDQCASALFTDEVWANAKALRVEIPSEEVNGPEGKEARSEVIDFSIALRIKRSGMTPSQARRDARAFGELWWRDREAARRQLVSGEPPARPPAAQSDQEAVGKEAPQRDGKAIASLVFGVLSLAAFVMFAGTPTAGTRFGVLVGIPAILVGHVSRSQIKKNQGKPKGKGMALAGLILGYLGVLPVVLTGLLLRIPGYR